ncbi:hypothetical protein BGX31_004560 [Mortierella sp. GBA43]|nr:hypothetical protein BGX31_004560 [Mortierella sp. GBA43]
MLRARHRLSSSVVPPLPALQQLYSFLDVAGLIDQLTADDWNSYIFWLSHHKDYSTMSRLHSDMFSHPAWSSKYSPLSYTLLIKARQSQSTLNHTGSDQSPSTIVQKTIDLMMTSNVPPNSDLYGLWLQRAVQERNWLMGIEAWTQMKAKEDQLSSPSIAMTTYAVQCYLHHHDMVKVEELFKLILEQSSSTQQRQNYAMVQDGGLLPEASADGERETSVMDGRLEFQRRLKQSMEDLTTLQQQNNTTKKSNKTNPAPSNLPSVQEWKGVINPALIEAICLSERSNYGAAAAAQLALELFNHGHVLDSTRFRYLIHYVGACNTSADAETLVKQLMSVSSKDEHNTRAKDSRKNKRIVGSTWLALIEVGLQEVVKQAILDWDFDRARKIFQGMAKERISLGIDASEKLIVGLIKINDCRMALAVLDKSLQENRVPTLDTLNQLFKGLIKYHMLDEAIAMFRDLTENNGLQPDLAMYRSLIRVSSSYGQLGMVQRVISRIRNIGVPLDEKIYKDMMLCYVRVDNLRGAVKVFEEMNRTGISSNIAHINVLLEGAVRSSSSTTVLGILEIMASLKIKPDPETWRIMLSGAFRAKDRVFASEIYQELIHAGTGDALARGEGEMHAPRHPRTFQLLLNEYSNRHGVDAGLRLLKSALDAGYPSGIASSMYLELIDKSCIQGKGVAGYGYYQLLRQSQRTNANMLGILTPDNVNSDNTELSRTRFSAMSSAPVHAVTSTSTTVAPIPLQNLFFKLLKRVEQEGQIQVGADMATDLIVSGFEMNPDLVESAIRFYSRSGELAAAFGLFMKMGHVYSVAPTRGMVQDLYAAARAQGLLSSTRESLGSAAPSKWDESLTQLWIKVLKEGMEKVEPAEDPTAL